MIVPETLVSYWSISRKIPTNPCTWLNIN